MKYNIAVTISGLIRGWDTTYKIFQYWNKLYDEIEFTFFLSTWKDVEIDFSQYDLLERYEILEYDEIPEYIYNKYENSSLFYAYALYRVHKLRLSYENETNIKFNAVMQVRNDMFVAKDTFENIRKLLIRSPNLRLQSNMFYSISGTESRYGNFYMPFDNFGFANPKAMDKYSDMYHNIYVDEKIEASGFHFMQAQHLISKNIYNAKMDGSATLIRFGNKTAPYLTFDHVNDILERKGVEYLYDGTGLGKGGFVKGENFRDFIKRHLV